MQSEQEKRILIKNRVLNAIYIVILVTGVFIMALMIATGQFYQKVDIGVGVVFLADIILIRYLLPKDMNGRMAIYITRVLIDLALIAAATILLMYNS